MCPPLRSRLQSSLHTYALSFSADSDPLADPARHSAADGAQLLHVNIEHWSDVQRQHLRDPESADDGHAERLATREARQWRPMGGR